jgi:hypothetical protein
LHVVGVGIVRFGIIKQKELSMDKK